MKLTRTKYLVILSLLSALALFTTALYGCGGNDTPAFAPYTVGSAKLIPGAPLSVTPDSLGTYVYAESGSCGGIPGMDKVYRYPGFTLYTTPGHDGDILAKIELTDDSTATPEGLRIGATRDDVIRLLGTGKSVGDNLVYTDGNTGKLTVAMRDDRVVGLVYAEK